MEPSIVGNEMRYDKKTWEKIYVERLSKVVGYKAAMENYLAIDFDDIDYEINPIDAADDEISYMKGN